MYLLLSLILALLLVVGLGDQIKEYPVVFYILALALGVGITLYGQAGLQEILPRWFTIHFIAPFQRGAFSTALFILVMYAGALDIKRWITRRLYQVRGEISMIACILTLTHNFIYGKKHFPKLFFHADQMETQYLIAAILTILMLLLMLPLMITSFQTVRKRMVTRTWKKIQRLAYPFFGLIYLHVMAVFLPKAQEKWGDILLYTVIFAGYAILRIRKACRTKKERDVLKKQTIQYS